MNATVFSNGLDRFNRLISVPGDSREDLLLKQIWFALAGGTILYPVTEVIILALNGITIFWYLKLALVFTVIALVVAFFFNKAKTELFGILLFVDVIVFLSILQFLYGGLLHSSGIAFIALAASILAMIFTTTGKAHLIFLLFLFLMIGGTFLQPYMASGDTTFEDVYKYQYLAKFLMGAFTLYLAFLYFSTQLQRIKAKEKKSMEELDAAKTRFYTNMTHEFRTPLSMILGWAEQISDDPEKHLEEGMDSIRRNGNKLLNMVNQLMDISKIEAGSLPVHNVNGDILPLIKSIVEEHRGVAQLRDMKLHYIQETENVRMDHDPEKIEAVLVNILSNAIKFTPRGGDIYVQSELRNGTFLLKVRDTGPGIPADQLPHIFDRFYQVDDSATRKAGGSGIGLAVTKGLVEIMGGTIRARSFEGQGASFEIRLPVTQMAQEAKPLDLANRPATWRKSPQMQVHAENGHSAMPEILVVEDNPEMLHFLELILNGNYRVLLAENGKQGVELAQDAVPDLVISDIMMPGLDGYDLCRALKEDIRTSHIPIILLTAKGDMDSKIEGLEVGAEAYLTKPFSKRELLVRIRKMFDNRKKLQAYYWSEAGINGNCLNGLPTSPVESAFMAEVREILENHISDPNLNVAALADQLHMSYSQLYRKVRSLTGRTPVQLIRNLRLRKAAELLRTTDLTVGEISCEVGIEDPVYFSRLFRKAFLTTPTAFRVDAGV